MRLITTPQILRLFYPSFLWEMPKGEKKLYLTFDDGPHPTITPQVLEILKKFNAKATFFCIGNNVNKYKETFELIKKEGHSVGNHPDVQGKNQHYMDWQRSALYTGNYHRGSYGH